MNTDVTEVDAAPDAVCLMGPTCTGKTALALALAIGQGAGIQQPLAIAIIAGLLLQYPLVLLAMPVLVRLTTGRRAT